MERALRRINAIIKNYIDKSFNNMSKLFVHLFIYSEYSKIN